jgi:hypothetical protein
LLGYPLEIGRGGKMDEGLLTTVNGMASTTEVRRDFQAVREIIEMPTGGTVDVGVTEDGQVKIVLTGGYHIEAMFRGRRKTLGDTIVILVPE